MDTTAGRNRCGHYVIPREPEIRLVLKSLNSRFSPIQNSPVTGASVGTQNRQTEPPWTPTLVVYHIFF